MKLSIIVPVYNMVAEGINGASYNRRKMQSGAKFFYYYGLKVRRIRKKLHI